MTALKQWFNDNSGALIAAVISAIPGTIALVLVLVPTLQPNPGLRLSAAVKVTQIDANVTYRAFLDRTGGDTKTRNAKALPVHGYAMYVRIDVSGRKRHNDLILEQHLYDAATKTRLPGDGVTTTLNVETDHDRWEQPQFVIDPRARPVFARFEVYDKNHVLLASADSPALHRRSQ